MSTQPASNENGEDVLTDDEQALLEKMKQALASQADIPESERAHIVNRDKFSFPIGFDENGQPLTGEAAKQIYEDLAQEDTEDADDVDDNENSASASA